MSAKNYVPPILKQYSKKNKLELARGKLVDKYKNLRTFILSANSKIKNKQTAFASATALTDKLLEGK